MIPDKDTTFDTNLSGGMMGRFSRPLTSMLPIRRVAAIVGYHDPSRFAQHFRRRFQALPNAYRDQHGSSGS
jgi:AraC-like DNA-binding protein